MQKKSLLVALFCGALCLTGCLKNEESASVAQVRMGKAAELNSIAKLNEAKAAAEAVYAQAELTVAQAEAKLREAQANLVNAQAETEKVRAELLKVKVALQEVKVDEERVKLLELEAKLEQTLAEVEAAVAKAEADKQKYINEIEHQVALAEKQAIDDALAILKAEDALQKYLLDQEGVKAENAKAASVKYFAALKEVQNLQRQQIVTKAEKALVEAGAVAIRDAIHFEMEQIDDEIAKKEALVEYLKEHQTMTPEEAEEALIAARTALNEAYNDYKDAQEAEGLAKDAYDAINVYSRATEKGLVSAFTYDWDDQFTDFIEENWGFSTTTMRRWGPWTFPVTTYTSYIESLGFDEYEGYEDVIYWGYADPEDPTKFIKLWKTEQPQTREVLYPTIEEQSVRNTFNKVEEQVIAPAEIFYDNIAIVLDSITNRQKAQIAKDVQAAKDESAQNVKAWNKTIDFNKDKLVLIKEYVDARKDTVTRAETALANLVAAYNRGESTVFSAQKAYYDYMLVNYNISRDYFEAEIKAAKDTVDASKAYYKAKGDLEAKASTLPGLLLEKKDAKDALEDAHKDYNDAEDEADDTWEEFKGEYLAAIAVWSPFFEGSYTKTNNKNINGSEEPYFYKYHSGKTEELEHIGKVDSTGTSQKNWLIMLGREEAALKAWDAAKAIYIADPTAAHETDVRNAESAYSVATGNTAAAKTNMNLRRLDFIGEQDKYDLIWGAVEEAKEAYNPGFDTTASKRHYDKTNEVWYNLVENKPVIAGTTQAEYCMADSLYREAYHQVNDNGTATDKTLKDLYEEAAKGYNGPAPDGKWTVWKTAFESLLEQLEVTKDKYKADPKVAELYNAWQKEKDTPAADYRSKLTELTALYNVLAPDTPFNYGGAYNQPYGYGWYISNYHLNPEYEYVYDVDDEDGDGEIEIIKKTAAELIYGLGEDGKPDTSHSFTQINADYAKKIEDEPVRLQKEINGIENSDAVKRFNQKIADVKAALKQYQSYEAEYKTWVSAREEAFKAWNEAKKDTYDAADEKDLAQAIYDGAVTLANGGMWVYDPDWKIFDRLYPKENHTTPDEKHRSDDFTWINVNDEIETLEGDTADLYVITGSLMKLAGDAVDVAADMKVKPAELQKIMKDISKIDFEDLNSIGGLNFAKSLLQKALNVGKVTLQYVLDAFDEEIAVLDEKIDLYTKLAATYKAIMNGWLGIVDEAVVEEPVEEEGEGDDEE